MKQTALTALSCAAAALFAPLAAYAQAVSLSSAQLQPCVQFQQNIGTTFVMGILGSLSALGLATAFKWATSQMK